MTRNSSRRASALIAGIVLLSGCVPGPAPDAASKRRGAFCASLTQEVAALPEDFGYLPTYGYEVPCNPMPGQPACFGVGAWMHKMVTVKNQSKQWIDLIMIPLHILI